MIRLSFIGEKLCLNYHLVKVVELLYLNCVVFLMPMPMKAVMIVPVLLLQKPHHKSKNHENIVHLIRCLATWSSGDINSLVQEDRVLQGI